MSKIILGIDPGIADTGWGVIKKQGQKIIMLACGSIKTPAKTEFINRLKTLHQELSSIIKKYQPDAVSVEELFFCKNVKTALAVGQARGVVLMTIAQNNLPIAAHPRVPAKEVAAVREAFIRMADDPEGLKVLEASAAVLKQQPPYGFVTADNNNYQNYREYFKTTLVRDCDGCPKSK